MKNSYIDIYGYSDTWCKHNFTRRLRINEIKYEFIESPHDLCDEVVIRIIKPNFRWQKIELQTILNDILK